MRKKASAAMNWNFRNVIMEINDEDIVIEIVNDKLIIGNNKWPDAEQTVYIAEIAGKIASLR
jgi:hypothetical protein